ncbi:MAG: tetratricopeptide repeat protein, partial [Terriglobales bacterium]
PNTQVLQIFEKLRLCLINLKDYKGLAADLKQELAIYEQIGSRTKVYGALNMLTWCYYNLRDVTEAQGYAERTIKAASQTYGIKSAQYGSALQDLGSVQLLSGNYAQAEQTLRRAMPYEAAIPETHMITMAQIAITEAAQGRYEQARTTLEAVVDESRQSPMTMKLTTGKELSRLAEKRRAAGKIKDAEELEKLAQIPKRVKTVGVQ